MTKYDDNADEAITPGGELDNQLLEDEYLNSEKGKMNTLQVLVLGRVDASSSVST